MLSKWSPPIRHSGVRELPLLPNEVYFDIFDRLRPHTEDRTPEDVLRGTLRSLALVCRFFRATLLPRIFHVITHDGQSRSKDARQDWFAQIEVQELISLELANHVVQYTLSNWDTPRRVKSYEFTGLLQKQLRSPALFTNLTTLSAVTSLLSLDFFEAIAELSKLKSVSLIRCTFLALHKKIDLPPRVSHWDHFTYIGSTGLDADYWAAFGTFASSRTLLTLHTNDRACVDHIFAEPSHDSVPDLDPRLLSSASAASDPSPDDDSNVNPAAGSNLVPDPGRLVSNVDTDAANAEPSKPAAAPLVYALRELHLSHSFPRADSQVLWNKLERMPYLTHLTLGDTITPFPLPDNRAFPSSCMPYLSSITGPTELLTLVPGRPVAHVKLRFAAGQFQSDEILEQLRASSVPLTTLGVPASVCLTCALVEHFPQLEALEVYLKLSDSESAALNTPLQDFCRQWKNAPPVRELAFCMLGPFAVPSLLDFNLQAQRELIVDLLSVKVPTARAIAFNTWVQWRLCDRDAASGGAHWKPTLVKDKQTLKMWLQRCAAQSRGLVFQDYDGLFIGLFSEAELAESSALRAAFGRVS